jgi:hypothetical protein
VLVHQPGEAIARDALQVILQIEVVVGDASEEFAHCGQSPCGIAAMALVK